MGYLATEGAAREGIYDALLPSSSFLNVSREMPIGRSSSYHRLAPFIMRVYANLKVIRFVNYVIDVHCPEMGIAERLPSAKGETSLREI